jgi:hypothetical protein
VALPAALPVTVPEASTDATVVLELLHAPPGVALNRAVVPVAHTLNVPVMGVMPPTVTTALLLQVVEVDVKVMAVVPGAMLLTTPLPVPTVATAVVPLVQVPVVPPLSVVLAPAHMLVVPVSVGMAFTVTVRLR